jgi:hypothetical protein
VVHHDDVFSYQCRQEHLTPIRPEHRYFGVAPTARTALRHGSTYATIQVRPDKWISIPGEPLINADPLAGALIAEV